MADFLCLISFVSDIAYGIFVINISDIFRFSRIMLIFAT